MALGLMACLSMAEGPVFGLQNDHGIWWFKTPEGKRLWSFGVDCVDQGSDAKSFDPKNPSYASYQIFNSPSAWAYDTVNKLNRWGFNSLGGWSDAEEIRRLDPNAHLPYFEVLHLGSYCRAPFDDIFSDTAAKEVDDAAKKLIPPLKNDPDLVGYFSDNELGWWGDTLFMSYLKMPDTAAGKRRLMDVIEKHYGSSWEKFSMDWKCKGSSFADLSKAGQATLVAGGKGMSVVNEWLTAMGERYYSLMRDTIKRYDPSHLILGDRYCQFYSLPIAQSSAPYIDVASTNFGASWNDGSVVHFFLDSLNRATGKPVVVTEFYMGAKENRSGDPNSPPAFPTVDTQVERAAAFGKNVHEFAKLPFLIGAHWFQFYDEPPKGRGDGEAFNHGLVDIKGVPYDLLVGEADKANPEEVHAKAVDGPKDLQSVPSTDIDPLASLKIWPRDAGFIPPTDGLPFADMYACRKGDDLYLAIKAMDYMDESLYEGGKIPEQDRSKWTIRLAGKPAIVVRFGGKDRTPWVSDPSLHVKVAESLQTEVIIRIPGAASSRSLESDLSTHSRAAMMTWKSALEPGK